MTALREYSAPAKLNLMLRVTGRRADGYHLLQTVFRFIEFGDTVTLKVRADGAIARVKPLDGVPAERDLTLRAARLLQDVPGLENPTSEHLSRWLWERLHSRISGLSAITVHETCAARCTYRGD